MSCQWHGRAARALPAAVRAVWLALLVNLAAPALAADQMVLLDHKLLLVDAVLARLEGRADLGADAAATVEVARTLANVARADLGRGELTTVGASLDEALRLVGEVSRHASRPVPAKQDEERYARLVERVQSFREALDMVVAEKGQAAEQVVQSDVIDRGVQEAASLAARRRFGEAARQLADVYDRLSSALTRLRANETLQHRLVFESAEQEYAYELERYSSNRMLLDMMMAEKPPDARRRAVIDGHVAEADRLQTAARQAAESADFEIALRTQEDAVQQLVAALRSAGMYMAQ